MSTELKIDLRYYVLLIYIHLYLYFYTSILECILTVDIFPTNNYYYTEYTFLDCLFSLAKWKRLRWAIVLSYFSVRLWFYRSPVHIIVHREAILKVVRGVIRNSVQGSTLLPKVDRCVRPCNTVFGNLANRGKSNLLLRRLIFHGNSWKNKLYFVSSKYVIYGFYWNITNSINISLSNKIQK